MNYIHAIVLAIVEGVTEFLPVSSTGHMIIASSLFGIASHPFTKLFTVVIQFGAILSVLVLYRQRFFNQTNLSFYKKLLIAFLPSVVFGVLFKKQIDAMLENVIVVAISLLVGGVIFILLDSWFHEEEERGNSEPSNASALKIGMFQVLAMIPGVSRSAATIIGGLTQKLNKQAAAEFSFFLAVPTMFAASCKNLYDFCQSGLEISSHEVNLLIVGNIVAFIVAMIAIRSFVQYLTRHGFKIFGYYRIIVGALILILHFLGIDLNML